MDSNLEELPPPRGWLDRVLLWMPYRKFRVEPGDRVESFATAKRWRGPHAFVAGSSGRIAVTTTSLLFEPCWPDFLIGARSLTIARSEVQDIATRTGRYVHLLTVTLVDGRVAEFNCSDADQIAQALRREPSTA